MTTGFGRQRGTWKMFGWTVAIAGLLSAGVWLFSPGAAAAQSASPPGREHTEQHDAAQHAKEANALKTVFDGPVDLYFEPAQLSAGKPGISGAKFVDLVDVTGKALLRFEKAGEHWLVDPDAIVAFRVAKAK